MGFYGNVYYQIIASAFTKLLISNKGKNSIAFPENMQSNDTFLEATGRDSTATLSSGNRWIQLIADKNNSSCSFYHAPADKNASSSITLLQKVEDPVSNEIIDNAIPLTHGSYFEIPVIKYDDAGHLVPSEDKTSFMIPQVFKNINIGDSNESVKLELKHNADVGEDTLIMTFMH